MDLAAHRWLTAPDEVGHPDEADQAFARWILSLMTHDSILDVGGILVDRAVLHARFSCVPERCAPGPLRTNTRSCCADLTLPLTVPERRRLRSHQGALRNWLAEREPRLTKLLSQTRGRSGTFFLDADGTTLKRIGKRCVFSMVDARGRIRCHLHPFCRRQGPALEELQPFSCRLFPLVLVNMGRRVMLTVLDRRNHRAWQALPPWRFPCLSDPALPPLVRSMRGTIDGLFGKGFAHELAWFSKSG